MLFHSLIGCLSMCLSCGNGKGCKWGYGVWTNPSSHPLTCTPKELIYLSKNSGLSFQNVPILSKTAFNSCWLCLNENFPILFSFFKTWMKISPFCFLFSKKMQTIWSFQNFCSWKFSFLSDVDLWISGISGKSFAVPISASFSEKFLYHSLLFF